MPAAHPSHEDRQQGRCLNSIRPMGVPKQFVSLASHMNMAEITDKAQLGLDWGSAPCDSAILKNI